MIKSQNAIFQVIEDKVEKFLNRKRNVVAIKELKKRAMLFEKNIAEK